VNLRNFVYQRELGVVVELPKVAVADPEISTKKGGAQERGAHPPK
jgi:hypothetical protein